MSGFSRDRNIKVPKKAEKKANSSSTQFLPSRPAEGRTEVLKKTNTQVRPNSRTNQQSRQQTRPHKAKKSKQKNRDKALRQRRPTPLDDEVWARIIDNDAKDKVIVAIGESKMMIGRYAATNQTVGVGTRIYVGVDSDRRTEVGAILGMAKVDLLSSTAITELPYVIKSFIEENEEHFIKSFFNIAGPLSLKQHAFQLLPGIGKKKALQMVESRGSSGFSSIEQLNDKCSIDAAELLARRFALEIEDKSLQPRLTELLLPVTA